jgi:CCR4-NOT transcription complex subunit 9
LQQAQAQAAAVAAANAQHNHYNRIANNNSANHNHNAQSVGADFGATNGGDPGMSDENRRLIQWVQELLKGESREQALMELSKKREQVPELAMIIWYSFGTSINTWIQVCLVLI